MSLLKRLGSSVTTYRDPTSIGSRLRARRIQPLLEMIDATFEKKGQVDILDVGGTQTYWSILPATVLQKRNVSISVLNLPDSDSRDPARTDPQSFDPQHLPDPKHFEFVLGDGCDLSHYGRCSFDIVHSNSVLEHVGPWSNMVKFAEEVSRLAPYYFVQTPYFWFPVEPHAWMPFLHWLPKPMRVMLLMKFNMGGWDKQDSIDGAVRLVESARLLDKAMLRELFKDANIITERLIFLPKSLIAVRNK